MGNNTLEEKFVKMMEQEPTVHYFIPQWGFTYSGIGRYVIYPMWNDESFWELYFEMGAESSFFKYFNRNIK